MYSTLTSIIISRETFRENDLLITAYTKEKGKIVVQARGAKKVLSKLAGHLEPVSLSTLETTVGKNIDQLIGANTNDYFKNIKSNIVKTAYANYFLELINELTDINHPDPNIFNLLLKSLKYLENNENNLPTARISFALKLFYLLGLNPAEKSDQKSNINFIIQNDIKSITVQNFSLKNIDRIINQEIRHHLDKNLNSAKFLAKT